MNYKKFRDIGDSEPRPWNVATPGTKFKDEDDEDDEIVAPYCDDFDDDTESEDEEVEECDVLETETETDADSVGSVRTKRARKGMNVPLVCIVLHEETDFMEE